jgi:lysophospholipase L1-like esterase
MAVLEKYEWSDMWWDEPDQDGRRVLLVGDSITRGYRNHLKELAGDSFYLDMFATSRAPDNSAYLRELTAMLSNDLNYTIVHLNNGLHGFHQTVETYAAYYEKIIGFFQREAGNAAIILTLTTPVTKPDVPEEYGERNGIVKERNRAVRRLAEKYKLGLDDLYAAADDGGAAKANDGVHFTDDGYRILARQVLRVLNEAAS